MHLVIKFFHLHTCFTVRILFFVWKNSSFLTETWIILFCLKIFNFIHRISRYSLFLLSYLKNLWNLCKSQFDFIMDLQCGLLFLHTNFNTRRATQRWPGIFLFFLKVDEHRTCHSFKILKLSDKRYFLFCFRWLERTRFSHSLLLNMLHRVDHDSW